MKYFKSEFYTQGRREENDVTAFPEHITECTCPIVFEFYTQHL